MPGRDPTVEVYANEGCQASRATVDKLAMLGVATEVHPIDRLGKAWLARQGFTSSPVCILWVGEGEERVRFTAWEAYKPEMCELAARVGKGEG